MESLMKPKVLMLSAAVLMGSAGLAFAQTSTQPPQTPAGPSSTAPGKAVGQQDMNDTAPAGSKSMMSGSGTTATQSDNVNQPGSSEPKQAQSQAPNTGKHRAMASRRYEHRATEPDRATTALNLLEQKGYRDFSSFHRAGRDYEISANQNGKSVTVLVNPDTKSVKTQG
jgi:hypothetical protein